MTVTLETIKAQAEQGKLRFAVRHIEVPHQDYPAVCYRDPDTVVYTLDVAARAITQVNYSQVVTIPLGAFPEDFKDLKAILWEATKDPRPVMINGEAYSGVVYTDGERIGLMTQGEAELNSNGDL
jgi:hypothetical protein